MDNLKKNFLEKIYDKISKQELEKLEIFLKKELTFLEKEKNKLEKSEENIIITDLDDTIFSTKEIRKANFMEWKRWNEGNIFLKEKYWLQKLINNFYKNKAFPNAIISKLKENKDLILTTWMYELQIMKIKELKLDNFNYIITSKAEEKILALLKYIILGLKYLPKKITIYEDRPHFFIYFKELIENFLETKIEIIYVKMDWNNVEPKLEKIEF